MRLPLFELVHLLVLEGERETLNTGPAGHAYDPLRRKLFLPLGFVYRGAVDLFRQASLWLYVTIIAIVVIGLLISRGTIPNHLYAHWAYVGTSLVAFLLIAFALPSSFAFDSIRGSEISHLADRIETLGFDSEESLEVLEKTTQIVADRSALRSNALMWVVGATWAAYSVAYTQYLNVVLRLDPDSLRSQPESVFFNFVLGAVVAFLGIVIALCYKKAMDAVFRRLQFAINEAKVRLASRKSSH